jgi:hypothetical protein
MAPSDGTGWLGGRIRISASGICVPLASVLSCAPCARPASCRSFRCRESECQIAPVETSASSVAWMETKPSGLAPATPANSASTTTAAGRTIARICTSSAALARLDIATAIATAAIVLRWRAMRSGGSSISMGCRSGMSAYLSLSGAKRTSAIRLRSTRGAGASRGPSCA